MKGLFVAARAVTSSLVMIVLLIYVFGIVMHMALSHTHLSELFATLPRCMWTLLMDGVFMDNTGDALNAIIELDDPLIAVLSVVAFFMFILLSSFTIMNMLIGVLCEVVSTVAQSERDDAAIRVMKQSILLELKRFDIDENGRISKSELDHVMKSPTTLRVLRSLDVDVECLHELQHALFPHAAVPIEDIMELLLSYRGTLPCTVKHVVDAQVFTRWSLSTEMKQHAVQQGAQLREVHKDLQQVSKRMGQTETDLRILSAELAQQLRQASLSEPIFPQKPTSTWPKAHDI